MQNKTSTHPELLSSSIKWSSLVLVSCDSFYKPDGEVRKVQNILLTSELRVMENSEHTCFSASLGASVRDRLQSNRPLICPFMAFLFLIPLLFTWRAKSFSTSAWENIFIALGPNVFHQLIVMSLFSELFASGSHDVAGGMREKFAMIRVKHFCFCPSNKEIRINCFSPFTFALC